MQKLILSVLLGMASMIMFWLSYKLGVKMFLFPSEAITSTGRAGQSSGQIWFFFSLISFIAGLAILAFLRTYWKK